MLAIYVHARYRHHQRANTPWPLAVLSEARVLVPLAILCEATNFSFQVGEVLLPHPYLLTTPMEGCFLRWASDTGMESGCLGVSR